MCLPPCSGTKRTDVSIKLMLVLNFYFFVSFIFTGTPKRTPIIIVIYPSFFDFFLLVI